MSGFTQPQETWNQRFQNPDYVFGELPNAYLRQQKSHLMPGNALAVADGEGRNGVWLAEQGLVVDAFDFSEVAIQKANALALKRKVSVNFVCVDWESFDWAPEIYDNVVGIFFQFATPDQRSRLFTLMADSLRPGGTLIIQGYTERQLEFKTGGPGKVEHMYNETMMRDAFSGWEFIDLRTYEAELSEGSGHSGRSGLLGLTARKPL